MEFENEHIELLISKKLSGNATKEEETELGYFISLDPKNQKIYDESQRVWANARYPFTSAEINSDREKVKEKIVRELSNVVKRNGYIRMLYRIAAAIAVPFLIVAGWYWGNHFLPFTGEVVSTVTAPVGQTAECVLADGTHVWLNSGTTIRFDPALTGKRRVVNLEGEAYFKVVKIKDRPFIVNTKELQVTVLGTSFNVRAYPDEDQATAVLEEGSVELGFKNSPVQVPVKLKQGECASFQITGKKLQVEKADTYLFTAWRDGKYVFKDADLETIIRRLEKLYDIRIHLKDKSLEDNKFRGVFEYKEQNVFDALETIEKITSLKYRMDGRDIWLE